MPTIQEDPLHEGEGEVEQHKSPPVASSLTVTTIATAITPPLAFQALPASSPPTVDISGHLASTSPTTPIMVRDSSSTTTSPISSSSMSPSTAISLASTTTIPTLALPEAFARHMQNIPMELSRVLMNPAVQAALAQAVVGLPVPPLTESPKMEMTMQI